MADRSSRERELLEKAARYLPGGGSGNTNFPDSVNFLAREGRGSHIWDVSGNEYVDWLMGSGPMVLGHAHPAVVEAVTEAVGQGSTFFTTNEKAVLLAEELVNSVPCADKVRFTTSGTDACFQCMRAARAYRKRDKILKFEGGFHGTSDYALMSVTPSSAEEFPVAVPNSGGIPKAIQDLMLVAPFNDLETTSSIIDAHHDELAAVIVEPVQRIIAPRPGFLQGLRDLTARYDIPLIFDEVVTGYRLAYGGAQVLYGVTPDLTSMGKIMGGGYPLAAVMGREDIMSVYDQAMVDSDDYVNQIGTLNGNPIACAAGLATLAELRKEGAYERLWNTGRKLRDGLLEICAENGLSARSAGEPPIFDIYFTDSPVNNYRDGLAADGSLMARLNQGLLERGILKGWPQKYYPSLVHTDEDVERTLDAVREIAPTLA
ncbi:MAG: aminotransferase class III-fold pyridoxal phosphate-dependent enzyme [Chloroflexota bacterium]|nr:aminotransferase class III-fold pyridoxal phosphate-dependent enzyme [Chloroflexota bacterium]